MNMIHTDVDLIKKIQEINKQFQRFYLEDERHRKNLRKQIAKKLQIRSELNSEEKQGRGYGKDEENKQASG